MERSNFSFKFENKLNISCEKANAIYIKSPDWLKYKNTTINPKNVNDRYFPYDFDHTQHYKKIKNYCERVLNMKPFIDRKGGRVEGCRTSNRHI